MSATAPAYTFRARRRSEATRRRRVKRRFGAGGRPWTRGFNANWASRAATRSSRTAIWTAAPPRSMISSRSAARASMRTLPAPPGSFRASAISFSSSATRPTALFTCRRSAPASGRRLSSWASRRSRRISARTSAGIRYQIRPEVGFVSRRRHRPTVVFPQPLSPTMPRVSPLYTARSTPSTAFTEFTCRRKTPPRIGKYFFRPSASRRISDRWPPPVLVAGDEVAGVGLEHWRLDLGNEPQRDLVGVDVDRLHRLERDIPVLPLVDKLRHPVPDRLRVPVRAEHEPRPVGVVPVLHEAGRRASAAARFRGERFEPGPDLVRGPAAVGEGDGAPRVEPASGRRLRQVRDVPPDDLEAIRLRRHPGDRLHQPLRVWV